MAKTSAPTPTRAAMPTIRRERPVIQSSLDDVREGPQPCAAPSAGSTSSYEIISRRPTALLAALVLAAGAPPTARAADVTVVEPDGATVVRDDPALPPAPDLAPAGIRAPRKCAATAVAAA